MTAAGEALPSGHGLAVTGQADFTTSYLAHDAFTRDLRRLAEACLLGRAWTPRAATTWSTFTRQLRLHCQAEDEVLWLRLRASARPYLAAIDDLASERAHIEPARAAVDTAYRAGRVTAFYDALNDLGRRLGEYMYHDERLALPLIATHVRPAGWAEYTLRLRQLQGRGGAAEYLPWLLDGATRSTQQAVLAALPVPARALHCARWAPRYRRCHLPEQWP